VETTIGRLKPYFLGWLTLHLVGWSVVPWLTNHSLHLDTIEALVWGREWEWGYDKHPPLSAWAAEGFGAMFGDWGLYFLSQVCVVLAGCGVWMLGGEIGVSRPARFLGVILLDAVYYYQYATPEFNVNILQIPIWSWGWWAGFRGVRTGSWLGWIGLGLAVGLGALTKYLAVLLVAPFLLALWERGDLWRQLRRPGLYVAGLISIVVFLPHLLWMRDHDWITINYGLRRAESDDLSWWLKRICYPVEFLLPQLLLLLPLAVITFGNRARGPRAGDGPRGLASLALGGLGLIVFVTIAFGWRPVMMWAVPMPIAAGLWMASRWIDDAKALRAATLALVAGALGLLAYGIVYGGSPLFRAKPHRVNYDGRSLARQLEAEWAGYRLGPLRVVVGDEWLGGLVAWYGQDRPSVMIRGDLSRSLTLSDQDIRHQGAMVVWLKNLDASDGREMALDKAFPDLRDRHPELRELRDAVIPWPRRRDDKAGRFGIGLIPPTIDPGAQKVQ